MAMQGILSSLKTIINDDFKCPICSGLCTDTVINSECGHRCCRKCIPTSISCHPNVHFDHILKRLVTELVDPVEMQLMLDQNQSDGKEPKRNQVNFAVQVETAAKKATIEVSAQNQEVTAGVVVVAGGRKRDRSPPQVSSKSDKMSNNTCIDSNHKTNESQQHKKTKSDNIISCSKEESLSQVPASNSSGQRAPGGEAHKRTPIDASISNFERHDVSEDSTTQDHSSLKISSSIQPATNTIGNDASHTKRCLSMKETSVHDSRTKSGCHLITNEKLNELLQATCPHFQLRVRELVAFKVKFGHYNVTRSISIEYNSLSRWCDEIKRARKLIEDGKEPKLKLSKVQIEILDGIGFTMVWVDPFDKRVEDLLKYKAKFGHINVTKSKTTKNKPYYSLAQWCYQIRRARRLINEGNGNLSKRKLSMDQIKILDGIGFNWECPGDADRFEKHVEELRKFKAKFGHCFVNQLKCDGGHKTLGRWCGQIRSSRRIMKEGGKTPPHKLSKDQIESLDSVGFPWVIGGDIFEKRLGELRAYKAKFGHCKVSLSKSPVNKPYTSLAYWCRSIRRSRKRLEEGKEPSPRLPKLSEDQIKSLDDLGFFLGWGKNGFDRRFEELSAFKAKFGHCYVTHSRSVANMPYVSLAQWCYHIRRSRRLSAEGKEPPSHKLTEGQIEILGDLGFPWESGYLCGDLS